jgi:hypothetical protein
MHIYPSTYPQRWLMGKHGQPFTFAAGWNPIVVYPTPSVGHSDLPESGLKLSHTWAWMNWCSSKPVFLSWFLECSGKRVWLDSIASKNIVAIKMKPEKHNTTTDGSGLSVNVKGMTINQRGVQTWGDPQPLTLHGFYLDGFVEISQSVGCNMM